MISDEVSPAPVLRNQVARLLIKPGTGLCYGTITQTKIRFNGKGDD